MDALGRPLDQVLERVGAGDRALITALVAEATARLDGMTLDAGICHGDVSLDNLHVDGDRIGNLHFHLVDKPAMRGTESLGEGWVDHHLTALREAANGPLKGILAVSDA